MSCGGIFPVVGNNITQQYPQLIHRKNEGKLCHLFPPFRALSPLQILDSHDLGIGFVLRPSTVKRQFTLRDAVEDLRIGLGLGRFAPQKR